MAEAAQDAKTAEVIPLRPVTASKRASEEKWGKPVMDLGFRIVPSLLLRAQARLGLNPTQLAVLLHLADYWWDVAASPILASSGLPTGLSSDRGKYSATSPSWRKSGLSGASSAARPTRARSATSTT